MVSKAEVLDADWHLLRIEVFPHDDNHDSYDGFSRFWSKKAVLGAYWIAEKVDDNRVRIHLAEDVELEGFRESLSFTPDLEFKRDLLSRCNWDEVVQQVFKEIDENTQQLQLFDVLDADNDDSTD